MEYEWEKTWKRRGACYPCGVAVLNEDFVEACFQPDETRMPQLESLARVDVLGDILGDVQRLYDEAKEAHNRAMTRRRNGTEKVPENISDE